MLRPGEKGLIEVSYRGSRLPRAPANITCNYATVDVADPE